MVRNYNEDQARHTAKAARAHSSAIGSYFGQGHQRTSETVATNHDRVENNDDMDAAAEGTAANVAEGGDGAAGVAIQEDNDVSMMSTFIPLLFTSLG